MNKKLMAVAVAGALAAPAMAFAQASTVQIYGTLNAEYGFVNQPDDPTPAPARSRYNADGLNSGASNIGFKGTEKLGAGLDAWFQCETDVKFLAGGNTSAADSGAWCDRNSAIGLKGGFGNFFLGTWDTPLKQAVAMTRMLNETGWLGVQHILLSGAVFSSSNRLGKSINYVTPKFGGFTARAQTTTTNAAFDKASNSPAGVPAGLKGRIWGLGADYSNGPLVIAAGYERANDNRSIVFTSPGADGAKDTSWALGATYKFGKIKGGLTYTNQKAEDGLGSEVKRTAWNAALDWQITGPGMLRFGYTWANDYKLNAFGGGPLPDSGVKQWQIGYNHSLSKRTTAGIGYTRVQNDDNAFYNLAGRTFDVLGDNASAITMSLKHSF